MEEGDLELGGVPQSPSTNSLLFVWSYKVTFLPCLSAFFSLLLLSPRDKKIPCCLVCSLNFVSNIESGPFFKIPSFGKDWFFFVFFQEMANNASLLLYVLGLICLKT